MMTGKLPLSIRDVKPHPLATRINGQRQDGLPDGVHTGGAYLFDGEVYKPLDGRPYMNADFHCATDEDKFLEAVAGQPFFPRNWRVEERNGRRYLVRGCARILDPTDLDEDTLRAIWEAVKAINAADWEIGDLLSIGDIDGELFVVDCSTAHFRGGAKGCYAADDSGYVGRLFEAAGYKELWERIRKQERRESRSDFMKAFYAKYLDESSNSRPAGGKR